MRPRHSILLLSLAALPVMLAVILVGNGNLRAPNGRAPAPAAGRTAQVALQFLGGSHRAGANQCGRRRHYAVYPGQGSIRFLGAVSPAPRRWQLTVKLKACYAGQFQSAGSVHAVALPDGVFSGTFPIPIAGYYDARAELREGGRQVARSPKVYFEVR